MRRAVFFLALMAFSGVSDLPGQSAVDVKRPEEHARERKVIERRETQKARSTNLEIRGATAFKEEELRSVLKEEIATIHDFGLTAARADDAAFFLELFYRKHGYAKVDVHYSIEGGSRLVLNVTEGPQAILGTINFVGNNHVPAEKLFEYVVGPTRERYSRLQRTCRLSRPIYRKAQTCCIATMSEKAISRRQWMRRNFISAPTAPG